MSSALSLELRCLGARNKESINLAKANHDHKKADDGCKRDVQLFQRERRNHINSRYCTQTIAMLILTTWDSAATNYTRTLQ